jgi:ABC-2 type transport system ATP-binding protein
MLDTSSPERAPKAPAQPAAITVAGVSKTFRLPRRIYSTFKERALHPLQSREMEELKALEDVSVTIAQGEFFGIVGRNGSGKSTLLKCLAGIYTPNRGDIAVEGKLSPFIELGVGFNMDLTAQDNVVINAILLGLTRREANARFDDIIAFAELEEFVDLKLKNYSSGMLVRLAFAISTQADADVLLIDEVLAVGDAAFQQKCFEQFHQLKAEGRTIVFVTHDMSAVERFCDRAMLIERGQVLEIGDPHHVARAYHEINFGRIVHERPAGSRYGDQAAAEITAAWFENAAGERIFATAQGEPLTAVMEIAFHRDLEEPIIGLALRNVVGATIFSTRTDYRGVPTGRFAAGETTTVRVTLENWMAPSTYRMTPWIGRAGSGDAVIDLREEIAQLTVHGTGNSGGVFDGPHEIKVQRR